MLKHSFSDFSYAVNIDSAKKGQKEVLVCFVYNGIEVLKKVYIPEKAGTAYVLEAKKIIDQEMRDGTLAIYSHKFIGRNKRKKIQPKKVVAAAAKGEKIAPIATPSNPSPKGNKKWVIATVAVAAIAVACAATAIVFATNKGDNPEPPTPTNYHVVSFDTTGGTPIKAQKVEDGKTATRPETDPTKEDYTFSEWTKDGELFNFSATPITEDIIITATWTGGPKKIHTVEFDTKGGNHIDSIPIKDGETIPTIKQPTAKREGYIDTSVWYIDESTQFVFGDDGTKVTSNMTLYCKWDEDNFNATFEPDGGTWSDGKTGEQKILTKLGVVPTLGELTISRGDYPFLGWTCNSTKEIGLIPMKAGGETYTAKWGGIPTYDVAFNTDPYIDCKGKPNVEKNATYICDLYITEGYTADHEIDKENLAVYVGMKKLEENDDYDVEEKTMQIEGEDVRVLELTIHANCIDNAVFISAQSVERSSVNEFTTRDVGTDEVIITGLKLKAGQDTSKITEITIPNTYEGKEVIGIDAVPSSQQNNDNYRDGDGLLTGCSSLRKLTIPFVGLNKVADIDTADMEEEDHLFGALFGHNAFENAEVSTYQDYYYDWTGEEEGTHVLKDFAIPNTLKEVKITQYNDVKYGDADSKKSIPMGAFSNCAYITDIEIPDDSGVSFDRLAFSGCKALRTFKYTAPDTVSMEIGRDAFNGCGVLASFDFKKVKTIKKNAFANCAGMLAVYLPETIEKIETGAFSGYAGLVKCQPEENPTTWEDGWVDQITPVIYGLPSEETKPITCVPVGDFVCSCLITETQKPTKKEWAYIVQYLGPYEEGKTTITIPDTLDFEGHSNVPVKYIGSQAFMDYNLTKTITVECSELVSVGPEAFKKCYELTDINFCGDNNPDKGCGNLKTIGCNAFERCKNLQHIDVLNNKVETIGNYAFYNCPSLVGNSTDNKFNFPDVTSVGVSAFEFDPEFYEDIKEPALESVTLFQDDGDAPTKGVTFGDYAFRNCSKLTEVKYTAIADKKGEYTIPQYCFYGTAIKDIKIPQCTTVVDTAAYAYCQSAETIEFDGTDQEKDNNQVRVIGDSAFLRCTHLNYEDGQEKQNETYLPSTLESIGRAAFQDCFHLYGITCKGAAFKEIPDSMCYGDSRLNHFYYTGTAIYTKIGQFAFAQDQAFTYIGDTSNVLPTTLNEVGDRAFINCVSLGRHRSGYSTHPSLTFKDNGTNKFKMGEQVFYGCYGDYTAEYRWGEYTYTYNCNTINIDETLLEKIENGEMEGWNWTIDEETIGARTLKYYDLTGEGWGNHLYINATF